MKRIFVVGLACSLSLAMVGLIGCKDEQASGPSLPAASSGLKAKTSATTTATTAARPSSIPETIKPGAKALVVPVTQSGPRNGPITVNSPAQAPGEDPTLGRPPGPRTGEDAPNPAAASGFHGTGQPDPAPADAPSGQ